MIDRPRPNLPPERAHLRDHVLGSTLQRQLTEKIVEGETFLQELQEAYNGELPSLNEFISYAQFGHDWTGETSWLLENGFQRPSIGQSKEPSWRVQAPSVAQSFDQIKIHYQWVVPNPFPSDFHGLPSTPKEWLDKERRKVDEGRRQWQTKWPVKDTLAAMWHRTNDQVVYLQGVLKNMPEYAKASGQGPSDPTYQVTFNVSQGASIGQLNISESVTNIQTHIASIGGHGAPEVASAFEQVSDAILADSSLDEDGRAVAMENLEDLSEAATSQPEQRRRGRVIAALAAIQAVAVTATKLRETWDAWGPLITQHVLGG